MIARILYTNFVHQLHELRKTIRQNFVRQLQELRKKICIIVVGV